MYSRLKICLYRLEIEFYKSKPHQWLQKCVKCKKSSTLHILTQKTPIPVFVNMCKYMAV